MEPIDWLVTGLLFAGLGFHFACCLVPSLRYFNARAGAYAIGVAAYALIAAFPIADALLGLSTFAFRAYLVLAIVLLTVIAFRPYAFVRASGGSQPRVSGTATVTEVAQTQPGSQAGDIPGR